MARVMLGSWRKLYTNFVGLKSLVSRRFGPFAVQFKSWLADYRGPVTLE
ncbi:hypothetical protein SAMN04515647_0790 [Cohaesibacter sp. ES.047]|nr:hypothetical protein SAMN04515647_0790 [Cohaesibacter sp. ES.047]